MCNWPVKRRWVRIYLCFISNTYSAELQVVPQMGIPLTSHSFGVVESSNPVYLVKERLEWSENHRGNGTNTHSRNTDTVSVVLHSKGYRRFCSMLCRVSLMQGICQMIECWYSLHGEVWLKIQLLYWSWMLWQEKKLLSVISDLWNQIKGRSLEQW